MDEKAFAVSSCLIPFEHDLNCASFLYILGSKVQIYIFKFKATTMIIQVKCLTFKVAFAGDTDDMWCVWLLLGLT